MSISRRNCLASIVAAGLSIHVRSFASEDTPANALPMFRVKASIKIKGEVRLKSQISEAKDKSGRLVAAKTVPMEATTSLDFEEDVLVSDQLSNCQSYIVVNEATTDVQVDRHITKTTLRENCREIVRLGTSNGLVTACLDNPLFAPERDLLEGPINSIFLDSIVPNRTIKIADKWDLERDVLCRLFGLDAVIDGKLVGCLVDSKDDKHQIELKGTIAASVRKVATTMIVDAKIQWDTESKCLTWFAANIEETRDISEQEPGFKVLAHIQLRRGRITEMSNGSSLATIAERIPTLDSAELLQFQSDLGYFKFLASRKWTTYRDNGEEATYRFIVDNERVGQCHVTNMIDFEPGRQLSMDGFVADVKVALGGGLSEILETSEKVTPAGMRALRVASRGTVQGVDLQWIHYHLSNDEGRRAVLVFMLNDDDQPVFGGEDAQIASTFQLINWPNKLDKQAIEKNISESKTGTDANAPEKGKSNANTSSNLITRPKLSR